MLKYVLKRVIYGILTIWIVATATFILMRLVPGGPFLSEKAPTAAVTKALEAKYGMDKPIFQQYTTYIRDALHGDFGPSIKQRGRTVSDIISSKFPVSARLGLMAVGFALLIGVPLGSLAAFNRGKAIDRTIIVICSAGVAIPSFVICTLLMYIFAVRLQLLPMIGLDTPLSYIMPVFALALLPTSYVARLTRSSLLDVMEQDYIRTAKAKGVPLIMRIFKHALRNAIIPVITYIGPLLAYLVTGSMVVEKILTIPGLGGQYVSSIIQRDYPMIMGTTIFLAVILIFMNLLVDILYKIIDPRIKFR
ncbi:MAG: ABC transporter permease [Oscillospiraceae bacterium]|nr:ABC transporter permease [Oscillospiraceae bacterium]